MSIRRGEKVLISTLLLLLVLGCSSEQAQDLSILIITMDTTRADHLGCYGYAVDITPNIDRMAKRGVLFEKAYAPMPQTLPSHASLFTGLGPRDHHALENVYTLDSDLLTLAEFAGERGYSTGAFIGALVLDRLSGMDQGFEVFDQPSGRWKKRGEGVPPERSAKAVTDAALAWADRLDPEGAYLLWAHYYDPHFNFKAPDRYKKQIPLEAVQKIIEQRKKGLQDLNFTENQLVPYWHGYAAEIRFMDDQIGRLLQGLENRGLLEKTVIVLAGDHGEGLWEHGEKAHGTHLWEEMLMIPLIVIHPHGIKAGTRSEYPTILQDMEPTLKYLAMGLERKSRGAYNGINVWPFIEQNQDREPRPIFLERPHYDQERIKWRSSVREGWNSTKDPLKPMKHGILSAVIVGDYKLIREPGGEIHIYNLADDPFERFDLSIQQPELKQRLTKILLSWIEATDVGSPGANTEISEERRENLRALGYIR